MKSMSSFGCGRKSFRSDGKPCATCCAFFRMMWFPLSVVLKIIKMGKKRELEYTSMKTFHYMDGCVALHSSSGMDFPKRIDQIECLQRSRHLQTIFILPTWTRDIS
jgi:hypothetical protein